jgi:VWFA-related protein
MVCGLLIALCAIERRADPQAGAEQNSSSAYRLRVSVDEVILTFNADDANGLPVNDLKLDEVRLLDNGRPSGKVLAFQLLADAPIRAGILIDTSESMLSHIARDRAIAIQYVQRLLRQQTDRAFVADFVRRDRVLEPWTSDPSALAAAVRRASAGAGSLSHGTAIFDTVYRACLHQFGEIDHAASGNFILLFSDGEDNASDRSLQDAVDMCQRSNTAIYAFRAEDQPGFSLGPQTLAQLTAQTGGRVFRDDDDDAAIRDDLHIIEANLRNQYRLVYRPVDLQHDGSFHRITLIAPDRVKRVNIRSGYYAQKP